MTDLLKLDLESNIKDLLKYIGEDCNREGLKETPMRVLKMYDEVFQGYKKDPAIHLNKVFRENHHELVLVKDIPFYSHCEHHIVPFFGVAHIAYYPNNYVVGLSKLARLVDGFSKRLQVQERLTRQLADTIQNSLNPSGVMVVIKAEHMCMTMRGVQKPGTTTLTTAMRGVFEDSEKEYSKVLKLLQNN
ncbi:GTP cyclohydrolase I FolE [Bacillus pumilus]|uniref:GTP cyclohydrolase I FolE n=1 Tax=Bacillus pumilus TaxID=1408 RepID=UPI002FFEBABE